MITERETKFESLSVEKLMCYARIHLHYGLEKFNKNLEKALEENDDIQASYLNFEIERYRDDLKELNEWYETIARSFDTRIIFKEVN